ncbi:MAG: hypothetical protein HRT99_00090 [Mycoplasmatales bacterium]|nr:hypothetical protein [Mycoplasmatales bacterium]
MSAVEILFATLLPILTILSFSLYLLYLYFYNERNKHHHKGVHIFNLDLYSKKIRQFKSTKKQKSIFKGIGKKDAIPLKNLLNQFDNSQSIKRKFREAMVKITSGVDQYSLNFEGKLNQVSKKNLYFIEITFYKSDNSADYLMILSWRKKVNKKSGKEIKVNYVDREHIININSKFKGFIAFNINQKINDSTNKFIKLLKLTINKDLTYFKNNDVLIIVLHGPSMKNVNRQILSFISKIRKRGKSVGYNMFFNGSGYITLQEIYTHKSLNQAIRALDFFIILSIDLNKEFISNQTEEYNAEEYKKYSKAVRIFRFATRTGRISTTYKPVRRKSNNREIIRYAHPGVSDLNNNILKKVLSNGNNKIELMDAQAKIIGINKKIDTPVLIDVNSHWLIKNQSRMQYKKAIYVVNLNSQLRYNTLMETIKKLQKEEFVFAIRITKFTEMVGILIKQTNPQFILVDGIIWGEEGLSDSNLYITLLTIKKVAQSEKIKVIYENPPEMIDKKTAKNIGMQFYYKI